jgi:DNA-binding CsgD family transcriptional regulator
MTAQPFVYVASDPVRDRDSCSRLAELCERYPTISILVLSGQREGMLGVLQLLLGGSVNIPPEILTRNDASAQQPDEKQPTISRSRVSTSDLGLTQRQLDVLTLMMQGKTNKAICRVLNLAESTVKNHVTAILRALEASNRTEAVVALRELGSKLPIQCNLTHNCKSPAPRTSNVVAPAVS